VSKTMLDDERFVLGDDGAIWEGEHRFEAGSFIHKKERAEKFVLERALQIKSVQDVLAKHYATSLAIRPKNEGGLFSAQFKYTLAGNNGDLELLFRPDGLVSAEIKLYDEEQLTWERTDAASEVDVPDLANPKKTMKTQAVVASKDRAAVCEELQLSGWRLIHTNP
jgi:hypothetical protein